MPIRSWGSLKLGSLLILNLVFALTLPAFAQADPILGVWKLDVAKSKFETRYVLEAETIEIRPSGTGIRVVAETKASALMGLWRRTYRSEFTAEYNGQDYPISGLPDVDTVSLRRLNAATVERIDKKGARVVQRILRRLSSDGRSMGVEQEVIAPDGTRRINQLHFEKQSD